MTKTLLNLAIAGLFFSSAVVVAEGNWIEDQNGCKHWNSEPSDNESVTWSGNCLNGYASGYGKFQWYKNDKKTSHYIGNKDHGKNSGQGKYTSSNGSSYEGEWKDDKRSGQGKYISPNGSSYEGEWKDDKQSGQGKLISSDTTITGNFSNGEPTGHIKTIFNKIDDTGIVSVEGSYKTLIGQADGEFTRTYSDGRRETVIVKNGKLYANKSDAEVDQAITGYMTKMLSNFSGNKASGSSCVDTCRDIRNEETQNCKTAFAGGTPQDTSECIKEALGDYGTCKSDCRHAKIM